MVETLHFLNGCLVVPGTIAVAIILFLQHRAGKGLTPLGLAAVLVAGLLIFAQVYMGISLLSNRGQRSMLHYSLGVLPLLVLLVALWLVPQMRERKALVTGFAFIFMALFAFLAYFIG